MYHLFFFHHIHHIQYITSNIPKNPTRVDGSNPVSSEIFGGRGVRPDYRRPLLFHMPLLFQKTGGIYDCRIDICSLYANWINNMVQVVKRNGVYIGISTPTPS
jgi:hypothetical protein